VSLFAQSDAKIRPKTAFVAQSDAKIGQNRYLSPFKQQSARKRAVGLTIAQHGFFVASSQQPTRPSHDDAIVMIAWFGMTIGGAS